MARLDYKAIAQAADMEDVLVALGIESHHGKALCPFHDDRNPSMQIYHDGYHCFVCGAHGDAIDLVQQVRGCSRRDAAKIVAHIAGGALITETNERIAEKSERKRREEEYEAAIAERDRLEQQITVLRKFAALVEPFSVAWCDAQRKVDRLLYEYEQVDSRIVNENHNRMEERNERAGRKKEYSRKVL